MQFIPQENSCFKYPFFVLIFCFGKHSLRHRQERLPLLRSRFSARWAYSCTTIETIRSVPFFFLPRNRTPCLIRSLYKRSYVCDSRVVEQQKKDETTYTIFHDYLNTFFLFIKEKDSFKWNIFCYWRIFLRYFKIFHAFIDLFNFYEFEEYPTTRID